MNNRKIALGPGAASLILIVVVLALCMLSMLTLVTARNDVNLGNRTREMIESVYALNDRAERRLAELDAVLADIRAEAAGTEDWLEELSDRLPGDMTLDGDIVSWTEPGENRRLDCQVRVYPQGEAKRVEWVSHRLIVDEPEGYTEWD